MDTPEVGKDAHTLLPRVPIIVDVPLVYTLISDKCTNSIYIFKLNLSRSTFILKKRNGFGLGFHIQ